MCAMPMAALQFSSYLAILPTFHRIRALAHLHPEPEAKALGEVSLAAVGPRRARGAAVEVVGAAALGAVVLARAHDQIWNPIKDKPLRYQTPVMECLRNISILARNTGA